MPATSTTTEMRSLVVNRKQFLAALDRVKSVVPAKNSKPILTGVHLDASGGMLRLCGSDAEIRLITSIDTDGDLAPCVIPCTDLVKRVKASKNETCTLSYQDDPPRLIVNGGRVEHTLVGMPVEDFPPIPDHYDGDTITIDAAELKTALSVAGRAAARESSRYAINGVLMESDEDGVRFVATDGRRLVVVALNDVDATFEGQMIIPARVTKLVEKLSAREKNAVTITAASGDPGADVARPSDVSIAGSDWMLFTPQCEGKFPKYRDVIPGSASRFVIDRKSLIDAMKEVALATSLDSQALRLDLSENTIKVSAQSTGQGESTATLPARFLGGGDNSIRTAFDPSFLLDALQSLSSDQIVIDVDQNGRAGDTVFGKPALIHGHDDSSIRWVIMPVSPGLPATRENLGSNYKEES